MNSMNHYAYGSVMEWLFKYAAGLFFAQDVPGCRKVTFRPVCSPALKFLEAVYESPAGRWECGWRYQQDGRIKIRLVIPFGCEAEVKLPCDKKEKEVLQTGSHVFEVETV